MHCSPRTPVHRAAPAVCAAQGVLFGVVSEDLLATSGRRRAAVATTYPRQQGRRPVIHRRGASRYGPIGLVWFPWS